METPNYVLKANEGILVPKNENLPIRKLRIPVWIIVGLLILGSFIFQDNLFGEISWTARILLISIVILVSFNSGYKRVPSPFEIQFYDDYLIVYREKRYYDRKVTRKEYNKFFYKDIHKCEFRTKAKRINILGIIEATWYDYNKDGSLPEKPTYHRTINGGICYFYTTEAPDVDFVSEIEKHSPIKVIVEDV